MDHPTETDQHDSGSRWAATVITRRYTQTTMAKNLKPFRFSLRRLFALIVVVAAAGGLYVATVGRSPMSRLFGGGENMAIVREATRVEAYRVAPPRGSKPMVDYISPLDFEVAAGPAEMAKELATTLLSADAYYWGDDLKACGYPVYGVKLSFFEGTTESTSSFVSNAATWR